MTEEEKLDSEIMFEEIRLEDMDLDPSADYHEIMKKHNKIAEMKERLRDMYDKKRT